MYNRVLIAVVVFCSLLLAPIGSEAASRRGGYSGPSLSRSSVRVPSVRAAPRYVSAGRYVSRSHGRVGRHGRGFVRGGLNPFIEIFADTIADAIVDNIDVGFSDGVPVEAVELPSLDYFGVPPYMQPHVYGLLDSGDPRLVSQAYMMMMHYQLNARARVEGEFRRARVHRIAKVYSKPLK